VVASVLVQLEGQGGHPGSDGGPPCYLDRAPGATRGIPATTWRTLERHLEQGIAPQVRRVVATDVSRSLAINCRSQQGNELVVSSLMLFACTPPLYPDRGNDGASIDVFC